MMRRIVGDPGPLCTLLMLLQRYEWAIEADLALHGHRRYSDRWRFDEFGCRRLTLREIWNCLRGIPPGKSVLATALNGGRPVLDQTEILLADLWTAMTGQLHPQHPAAIAAAAAEEAKQERREQKRLERVAAKRLREAQQRGEVIAGG